MVARQAIFNRIQETIGYELLFRDLTGAVSDLSNGLQATLTLLNTSFIDLGLENLIGSAPAFVNIPTSCFGYSCSIPPSMEQLVLEFTVTPCPDPLTIAQMMELADNGKALALDHYTPHPNLEPLLPKVRYAKIDIQAIPLSELPAYLAPLKAHAITTIALKVESHAEFDACLALGFDGFQGFFLSRPNIVRQWVPLSNQLVLITLLTLLNDPHATLDQLEQAITQDLLLSYRLLRYINCATFALRREIKSIREAILCIGLKQVREWTSVLVMARTSHGKPAELFKMSLIRAHLCQHLAQSCPQCAVLSEEAFTTGLFSLLDAVTDTPMEDLLDQLPLTVPIKLALVAGEGDLGNILHAIRLYEQGNWEEVARGQWSAERLANSYHYALAQCEAQSRQLITESP